MARLEARPTEYRGVRFRSKCEAMFALWLDLQSDSNEKWSYEPDFKDVRPFSTDFWTGKVVVSTSNIPVLTHRFIEYKPSRPTKTYCVNYFSKFVDAMIFCDTKFLWHISRCSEAVIYYGSIYSEDRGFVTLGRNGSVIFQESDWLNSAESSIANYRFDLQVQHG